MPKANLTKDRYFLRLVKRGILTVTKSGKVINNRTGRRIGWCMNTGYIAIDVDDMRMLVHRLVHLVHIGPLGPDDDVNHIDENKTNNRVSNLEKVSNQDNQLHSKASGSYAGARRLGKRFARMHKRGVSDYQIAAKTGIPRYKVQRYRTKYG